MLEEKVNKISSSSHGLPSGSPSSGPSSVTSSLGSSSQTAIIIDALVDSSKLTISHATPTSVDNKIQDAIVSSSPVPSQPNEMPNKSPITIYNSPSRSFRPDHLTPIDVIIVVLYICLILSTSISTMMRTKRSKKRKAAQAGNQMTNRNSFLASGRKMNWFMVGASIFASNLGSEHFIGLSGSAAANGISVGAFELNALVILQLAAWVFLPVLIVSQISTIPEYMSKRFGGKRIRTYLALLAILLYISTKISVNLFSGGIFIQQAIGWNLYTSAMFILALTCIMTLTGGLKGAMVIDNLQAFVMTVGASIVSVKALIAIGGWNGLKQRYPMAIPSKVPANLTHCAKPNPRAFQLLRPLDDNNMPWLGFLLGQTPASIWYWAADQMMVQRFLSARSLAHVQGSAVFAGYLKVLPILFMIIPGMISRCLFTDEVACIDPVECQKYCQSSVSCSNTAYPRLVLGLLPSGVRGMLVASMVAALMADLCNVFNSASALFSCDIYPLFVKNSTQRGQETSGRIFVIFLVLASIMWIPAIQEMQGGQLFIYIQSVGAMFAPSICAVYMCAILWKRTNESGAFWSLMIGFALGFFRLVLSFMYKEPSCGQDIDERPWLLKHVHYMYYAFFLFIITTICIFVISYFTKPPAPFRLIRTTFWTRFDTNFRKDDKNYSEMKSNGAMATLRTSIIHSSRHSDEESFDRPLKLDRTPSESTSDISTGGRSSLQHLFTINEHTEKEAADLSSVVVDITQEASKSPNPAPVLPGSKRIASLQHQASLGAAAATEAGKFIASKLSTEVKEAKEIVKAAASHITNVGISSSNIKFKNLQGDDDGTLDSTMDEEEEETLRKQRLRRNRRKQSMLSAFSSYTSKQKGGYRKALNFDEDYDEDNDEEDDDDNENVNLSRSVSFKNNSGKKSTLDENNNRDKTSDARLKVSGRSTEPRKKLSGFPIGGTRRDRFENECEEGDSDNESGAADEYIDKSVSLLTKTRIEEIVLRTAVVAISLVTLGLYIIMSLPPTPPPSDVVDILIKN